MFERMKEMDRRTLIIFVLAGVVGILLFSAIANGIRQAGWQEGFTVGLLSSGGESAKAVPPAAAYQGGYHGMYGYHHWGWHPFGFIGGFFRLLFFGFLVVLFLKFLGFWRWRMHGGHSWRHHQGPWGWHENPPHRGQPQPERSEPSSERPTPPEMDTPQPTSWTNV